MLNLEALNSYKIDYTLVLGWMITRGRFQPKLKRDNVAQNDRSRLVNRGPVSFSFLYVFVVFEHGRRRVIHFSTAYHPSLLWVIQQLREATPFGFGHQPKYLLRDNEGIYGHGVPKFLDSCNIEEVRTAYRSPWQNPYVERFVARCARNCSITSSCSAKGT